eukprot:1181826-Prorocentrum_minimum.AAC.1
MFDAQVEGTGLKALPPTRAAPGLLEHTGHAGEKARETMGRIVERLRKHDRSAHRQYNGLRRKREGKQECAKGRGNTNTSSVSLFAITATWLADSRLRGLLNGCNMCNRCPLETRRARTRHTRARARERFSWTLRGGGLFAGGRLDVKGNCVDVKGNCVDVKGNRVDVKGNRVDVKGNRVDVKGNSVDVKGNRVDVKGKSVDVKGNRVDVKGKSMDVKGNRVDVKGNSVFFLTAILSRHGHTDMTASRKRIKGRIKFFSGNMAY